MYVLITIGNSEIIHTILKLFFTFNKLLFFINPEFYFEKTNIPSN